MDQIVKAGRMTWEGSTWGLGLFRSGFMGSWGREGLGVEGAYTRSGSAPVYPQGVYRLVWIPTSWNMAFN